MTRERFEELERLTREQIASTIEDDLNGERIMKEVWEQTSTEAEEAVVKTEMRALVALIRGRN